MTKVQILSFGAVFSYLCPDKQDRAKFHVYRGNVSFFDHRLNGIPAGMLPCAAGRPAGN